MDDLAKRLVPSEVNDQAKKIMTPAKSLAELEEICSDQNTVKMLFSCFFINVYSKLKQDK